MVFDVNLLIESDDLVVSNWTVKGTHTNSAFYDVEPSGEPVEINGAAVLRRRGRAGTIHPLSTGPLGRNVETWRGSDPRISRDPSDSGGCHGLHSCSIRRRSGRRRHADPRCAHWCRFGDHGR
jgi:hypothetical protein